MPPIATYDMAIPNGTSLNGQRHDGDEPLVNGNNGQMHHLTTNGVNGIHNTASKANKQGKHGTEKKEHSQYLLPSSADTEFDMICIGFGPAGLAIAAALHDKLASEPDQALRKVMFIEKQETFAWHAGMLLPGAKMQISFIKDLATLRDPQSRFTFVNYLHSHGRLVDFTNLDTFLPNRSEYADYMRWCASYFQDVVQYGQQVLSVTPDKNKESPLRSFTVKAMNAHTGRTHSYRGRNVVFANGGQPRMPKLTPEPYHPRIIHSSQYAYKARQILPDTSAPYQVAVIGAGQSAAEIFCNVQNSYPNAKVWLVMRQEFLRPSDDSPFVNSIFNPEFTDSMFDRPAHRRISHISDARATNYGVVRLNLLEHMYEHMYEQKRHYGPDERVWPHRILGGAHIASVTPRKDGGLSIEVQRVHANDEAVAGQGEHMEADLIIAATGYKRNAHIDMLQELWNLLPRGEASKDQLEKQGVTGWDIDTADGPRRVAVGRDYKVQLESGSVAQGSGIWLQGCCEGTHGLSDTLLSVLATRSGEIVESIFGDCS